MLAVLGILAAIMIPTLTGYITRAKSRQIQAETRLCVMAAQSLANDIYAKGYEPKMKGEAGATADNQVDPAEVLTLAELTGLGSVTFSFETGKAKVSTLTYKHEDGKGKGDGKSCTYTAGTPGKYVDNYGK